MKLLIKICLFSLLLYGIGRGYFALTDGFSVSEISYNNYDNSHNSHNSHNFHNSDIGSSKSQHQSLVPNSKDKQLVDHILSQEFSYLGKGCQSYVFASRDGKYVIKFLKYKRLRPHWTHDLFSFIPWIAKLRDERMVYKQQKKEALFNSWSLAYNDLPNETGLVYIHMNKTSNLSKNLTIYDKMGFKHQIWMDDVEFCIQKRGDMICSVLDQLMSENETKKAKQILSRLVDMMVSEYQRGYGDIDQAIMQNTGVIHGNPIHIDVGLLVYDERLKNPEVYHQEMFNRTYLLRKWLGERYPELRNYLDEKLESEIGDKFKTLEYIPRVF